MRQPVEHNAADFPGVTVFIVDDDDAMRRGLKFLVTSAGHEAKGFDSAQAFLDYYQPTMRGCLLLDVRMPGMSGLELQEHLRSEGITIPVIMVTAFGNIPLAVRAMKTGVFDFIEKPFEGSELLDRIHRALAREDRSHEDAKYLRKIRNRLDSLTPREREVLELVITGMLNKQIAGELGISIKTVENHRARVMDKMQIVSLAELVRLAIAAGVGPQ